MIGGLYTVDDLKGRCWIDPDDDGHDTDAGPCWHLRTARGQKLQRKSRGVLTTGTHKLWIPAAQEAMTPTRAAWALARPNDPVQDGRVVYRACCSVDCVNPAHMRIGTRRAAVKAGMKRGSMKTAARKAERHGPSGLLSQELKTWVYESTQTGAALALILGVSEQVISRARTSLRARAKERAALLAASSIFSLAQAPTE